MYGPPATCRRRLESMHPFWHSSNPNNTVTPR